MEEEERTFTPGQAEAMDALLSGRNVFLSGNAGTGKSYVLNAFIEELEEREVPYLAMAPTGIAAQNLHNGTTIHRTLQVGFGVLDPHDENKKTLTRKVLNKAEVIIIDEVSMCRIDLFERVMNMVLAAKRVSGRKQVVLVGDFFQLPPVVTDDDRKVLMQLWPGNDDGYAFKSPLWKGMGFEPHVLTEVVRQSDPEFIGQLNRARIGDRDCIAYFNERSISDRKRAPEDDLWLCATNRMASTINDERVGELERLGARARTYTAYSYGDVKPSDKPTDDKLRLVEGARVMLLANMPDHGLANGSLGTISEVGVDCVTVEFDDCEYPVEVSEKEWKVLKSSVRDIIGDDGNPAQELVTDTVGAFTQIPLRLAFAITIHKSQGQTFERCAVHSKVFGAGMLYVALSRCTTFDGLTVWPKIERQRLYANESVIEFYDSLAAKAEKAPEPSQDALFDADAPAAPLSVPTDKAGRTDDGMVYIKCPAQIADRVRDYQIKGFFKDACSSLRRVPGTRSSKLTAFKKVIDGTVFVEQRKIPFKLPDGAECGRCERPLRASSASGERVALAASETVPAGTVLEFSVLVMNPKDAETVREWLDYGRLRGLFQWRNSGKGRFEWEEVESED